MARGLGIGIYHVETTANDLFTRAMTNSPPNLISRNRKVQRDLRSYWLLLSSIRFRRLRLIQHQARYGLAPGEQDAFIRGRRARLKKLIRLWKDQRRARVLAMDTPTALAWKMGRILRANNAWHPPSLITAAQDANLRAAYRTFDAIYLRLISEGYDLPRRLAHYLGDDPVRQMQTMFQACSSWPELPELEGEATLTSATYHFSQAEEDILVALENAYPRAIRNREFIRFLSRSKSHVSRALAELSRRCLIINIGRERGYILTENGLGTIRKLLQDKAQ